MGRQNVVGAVHRPDMSVVGRQHVLQRTQTPLEFRQVNVVGDGLQKEEKRLPSNVVQR